MTTSTLALGDADIDREIGDRCRVYQEAFGFNASRYYRPGVIGMTAGRVAAVIVPRTLGVRVRDLLAERSISVPIFSVDHDMWVFLTEAPADRDDTDHITIEMFKYGVLVLHNGALIALPTPGVSRRCWFGLPDGHRRTLFVTVTDAVVAVADRTRT